MAITDPITGGETVIDDLINAVSKHITDPNERAELIQKIQSQAVAAAQASDQSQAQIMAAEAAQKGWFNKPHIAAAWVCLGALLLDQIVGHGVWLSYAIGHPIPEPPKFLTDQLGTLLEGIFGLGGLGVTHGLVKQWVAT